MIEPARVQEIFYAIVLHLTGDKYNFFLYHGKVKNQKATAFAERLSRKFKTEEDVINFFIANQIHFYMNHQKVNTWIGNFCDKPAILVWEKYIGKLETQDYQLKSEAKLLLELGSKLKSFHDVYPLVSKGKVSVATVSNFLIRFKLTSWKTEDPLLEEFYTFVFRIADFVKISKEKFEKAILTARSEL